MSSDAPRVNENHQCGTDSRNARKYTLTPTLTLNTDWNIVIIIVI